MEESRQRKSELHRIRSRRQLDRVSRQEHIERMVRCIGEELEPAVVQTPSRWSIYKVPSRMRRADSDAYTPHLVSIGPFHHGKNHLSAMEQQKRQYMLSFFTRTGNMYNNNANNNNPSEALRCCAAAMFDLQGEARNCYAGGIPYDDPKLAEILLVDGCFILELFIRSYVRRLTRMKLQDRIIPLFRTQKSSIWSGANDPIFQSDWLLSTVQRDLALLENQIPFFALQSLFDTLVATNRGSTAELPYDFLAGLAFDFFSPALHSRRMAVSLEQPLHRKHLLNLLLNFYLPAASSTTNHTNINSSSNSSGIAFSHNATKLREAGIRFKVAESRNLFDLKFDNGVLEVPPLCIHEWTDSLFRNLMAFEHCLCPGGNKQYIASYVFFMDRLIDTKQDVELLENERIIINQLGGGEYITRFFRNICKQVVVKDFYFAALCQDVETHFQSLLRRSWEDFKHHYFGTPLKIGTWVIGLLVLTLTTLQTVYSALQYYHPEKSSDLGKS